MSVANSDTLGRPHRSVPSLGGVTTSHARSTKNDKNTQTKLGHHRCDCARAVTVSVLLITHRPQARPLSLLFEKYGTVTTMDLFTQDVAFFRITNSSDKIYGLPLAGGTNTYLRDAPIGFSRKQSASEGSYKAICEFRNQTPTGSTHARQRVSVASLGQCLTLGPHSAVRLRVALPPEGQKRKVAVLCIEPPPGIRPFWTSRMGGTVIRVLPRAVAKKAMWREPAMLKVWCDRELSHDHKEMNRRMPPTTALEPTSAPPLRFVAGR